jgi:hypothetical protein
MPRVNADTAAHHLGLGAFGIAEDHKRPEGRRLALDLIEARVVTHLFVELASAQFGTVLQNAQRLAAQHKPLEDVEKAAPNGNLWNSPIPLGRVIATALLQGIPVHLADDPVMAVRASDYKTRHTTIRNAYRQVTNQAVGVAANAVGPGYAGCLFLWGGDHFEGRHALDIYIAGLPWARMG